MVSRWRVATNKQPLKKGESSFVVLLLLIGEDEDQDVSFRLLLHVCIALRYVACGIVINPSIHPSTHPPIHHILLRPRLWPCVVASLSCLEKERGSARVQYGTRCVCVCVKNVQVE